MMSSKIKTLVAKLVAANNAYRNTDKLLMSDDEYDRGIEELRRLDPKNAFLTLIGATPAGKTLVLPTTMASLDKILDGDSLERWKKRVGGQNYMISEKLDGISCLYCVKDGKASMYLRGDGVNGVGISGLVGLVGLVGKTTTNELPTCIVRGELIIRRDQTPAGSIGRSLINGWVHRLETAAKELGAVRFVAYELIQPAMSRRDQFAWLAPRFELPWYRLVAAAGLKEGYLQGVLRSRRLESAYATDGIVVADAAGMGGIITGEAKNPKDAIAFKMSLDEQKAETVVTGIEWNLSRQGMLIPTILIEPVTIGEANISRLSGHNAALIYREKLGPGARIIVRRSGDVIPTLDTVLEAFEASMPAIAWEWSSGEKTHAMAVGEGSKEAASKALLHALQTLEIDGVGPGLVDKLVEAGLDSLKKCVDASVDALTTALGPGRGPKLHAALRAGGVSLMTLMIASNLLPRGVGERKLRLLFNIDADPAKWTFEGLSNVNGWGSLGIQDLLKTVPAVLEWCRQLSSVSCVASVSSSSVASPSSSVASSSSSVTSPSVPSVACVPSVVVSKGSVVFTGVRDKALELSMAAAGWTMSDAVTKKTTIVIVGDDYDMNGVVSGKVKKAKEYGVRLMRISDFRNVECRT